MTETADGEPTRSIHLPAELVRELERRIAGSGFASVQAFVAFVMARLLDAPAAEPFSAEDEQRLREKLRSLGYID